MRKIIVATVVAACALAGTAGAVSAGEITGNGELKEVHGKSICAYSGQNDGYHIPELAEPEELPNPPRVQSFGAIVSSITKGKGNNASQFTGAIHAFGPGVNCRGNVSHG